MEYISEKDILIQQLQSALCHALVFIDEVERDFGVVPEEDVLERITAAIAAAKGE
jgi:CBS domain containing-hemolysin-like protein